MSKTTKVKPTPTMDAWIARGAANILWAFERGYVTAVDVAESLSRLFDEHESLRPAYNVVKPGTEAY